ncbi:MAG: hypothetical protein IT368_07215 [Candidatus Hydrogenedentes bacterium]|nr:hypothetical protein [Candidatus Hydrogenedentota bacterium]
MNKPQTIYPSHIPLESVNPELGEGEAYWHVPGSSAIIVKDVPELNRLFEVAMKELLRKNATVPSDKKLELDLSKLPAGQAIQIVLYEAESNECGYRSLEEARGTAKGLYSSVEEIDRYIDELRNEWER